MSLFIRSSHYQDIHRQRGLRHRHGEEGGCSHPYGFFASKAFGKTYPWATGKGQQLPSGYILPKKKKAFLSGRPIISFVGVPFRLMLNILARLIFQLIPVDCPSHFATGHVYTLLQLLKPPSTGTWSYIIKIWLDSLPASTKTAF